MARNNKPIRCICLNTGQVFDSITEAARALDLLPHEVQRVVIGDRRTAHGMIFERCPNEINNDNGKDYADYRILKRVKGGAK